METEGVPDMTEKNSENLEKENFVKLATTKISLAAMFQYFCLNILCYKVQIKLEHFSNKLVITEMFK